jgi:site-specific DNA-methyltransferase (adenine-specific)
MNKSYSSTYNPDVLSTLANLSSDEVFTPPHIVNQMLDMLPQELFSDKTTTFLDPATKSGVFLREITKRLIKGLEKEFPDLQERLDHILHNQVFGIAITELTALLSRRSLYCSKYPNSKYSISLFGTVQGNVFFNKTNHKWNTGKCIYCNASQSGFGREEDYESHAYEFIHEIKIEERFAMKFDVIIGNPPYQINVSSENKSYAVPIYQKFVINAMKLNPKYLCMITPSRWFAGGRGLDEFRSKMLNDIRIKEIHDYSNSSDIFPGVQIKGGVSYFLWDRAKTDGNCKIVSYSPNGSKSIMNRPLLEKGLSTFVRHNEAMSILKKVKAKGFDSFSILVSPQTPFGVITSFKDYSQVEFQGSIKFYTNNDIGFIDKSIIKKNTDWIDKHKIYISKAYGAGEGYPHQIINVPFIGEAGSCCSQTYLLVGPFDSKEYSENIIKYMKTKFFRSTWPSSNDVTTLR